MSGKLLRIFLPFLFVGVLIGLGPELGVGRAAVSQAAPAPAPTRAIAAHRAASVRPLPTTPAAPALAAPGLSAQVLDRALAAAATAERRGLVDDPETLTVIDYSLPSTTKRLWVFDLSTGELLFHELVAHGKNSGGNLARSFSNDVDSKATSLGLYVTKGTYIGKNGYSLRLDGLEPGFNDNAYQRAVVVHGASYVSPDFARRIGRIGRSWGCPALDKRVSRQVIDAIKDGNLLYVDYPDPDYLASASLLHDAPDGPGPLVAAR